MKSILIILMLTATTSAYQPATGYELDQHEIKWYLEKLKESPKENADEIVKFQRILKEKITDYVEYFIKYGIKLTDGGK